MDNNDRGNAPQACLPCRKQKRKCDKALPSCSLCRRMARACDYSEIVTTPTADDFAMLRHKLAELEARLGPERIQQHPSGNEPTRSMERSSESDNEPSMDRDSTVFPVAFFLDSEIYTEARMTVTKPSFPVPNEVTSALGTSILDIRDIVERYFANVHLWLPFVSRKRMQLTLSNPGLELSSDLALLLLSMKLVIHVPPAGTAGVNSPLYNLTKRYYSTVESMGLISCQSLQANLLIATYEIGHAIYPAAYLTTGNCARLGHMLGLHDRRNCIQITRRPGAWAEVEEQKRTWWVVMLLDRYVNLGSRSHPLATDDPARTDVLPADDTHWDEGEMATSEPLYVSSPTNVPGGPFARTCQAAHLLGRLIRLQNDRVIDAPLRFREAIQLQRTLQALANLLPTDVQTSPEVYGTPLALCYSSMMHLCDAFCCTATNRGEHTVEETEMQTIAIACLKSVVGDVAHLGQLLSPSLAQNPASFSPLVGDCIYSAAATYAWLVHEHGSPEMAEAYHTLRKVLQAMNSRWRAAGQYLLILDKAQETLYSETSLLVNIW
jgi:hypothetical protein